LRWLCPLEKDPNVVVGQFRCQFNFIVQLMLSLVRYLSPQGSNKTAVKPPELVARWFDLFMHGQK